MRNEMKTLKARLRVNFGDRTMTYKIPMGPRTNLPRIKTDIVDRLSDEADLRTTSPQEVDWKELHIAAAAAREK